MQLEPRGKQLAGNSVISGVNIYKTQVSAKNRAQSNLNNDLTILDETLSQQNKRKQQRNANHIKSSGVLQYSNYNIEYLRQQE